MTEGTNVDAKEIEFFWGVRSGKLYQIDRTTRKTI